MNSVEDRIRDAFGAAADIIQQNNSRGLYDRPRHSPRSTARSRLAPLAAAVAVAAIIIGAAVVIPLVLIGQRQAAGHRPSGAIRPPMATPRPRTIQVPFVVGLSRAAASSELARRSLTTRIVQTSDVVAPSGIVVARAPAGGSQVRAGATVTLTVAGQPAALRTVMSTTWQVSLSIPDSWTVTPYLGLGRLGYSGRSGYVQVDAAGQPGGIGLNCAAWAMSNVLHPYGSDPKIVYTRVAGQPACMIFPSAHAPRWAQRAGGPAFQQSTAYIQYRHSVQGYQLLVITADPAHLRALVQSIKLHQ